MTPKIPIISTVIVAIAVAALIRLGFWQLQRLGEKEALLARHAAAQNMPPISWPTMPMSKPLPLFRSATGNCLQVVGFRTGAGHNLSGESGYVIIANCRVGAEGPGLAVELGWSKNPDAGREYKGGLVSGVIAPDKVSDMRLVAAEPGPGLMASAPPSPSTIPNNHLMYAITWFLFALIAPVIYFLALRQRQQDEAKKWLS